MVKSIFKNVFMLLLLIIIILLVFGIFFYNIIPSNKIVPEKVQYALPEQLQQELEATLEEDEKNVLVTYVVKESDMNKYEADKNYKPGKIDPCIDNSGIFTSPGNTTNNSGAGGGTGGSQSAGNK